MQAIVFCGIQGSGKTSFYRERFFESHVRINLDMLKTRHREAILLKACLDALQPFVVDNTNPTPEERARFVRPATAAGFDVICYFFEARPREAIARNADRSGRSKIPIAGIVGTYRRLSKPKREEGFTALYRVRIDRGHGFLVEEMNGDETSNARVDG
ncbi:MAG: AAA family ATPase [Actinomycetota bacterium]|nr:AAA family ATPase [Actinomycetota bacterium]